MWLLLVGLPAVNDRPVVFVSVSHTVPSSLRNVRRNGVFCTFTCRPGVVTVNVLPSTTLIAGRTQVLIIVSEVFVLNAAPPGSIRTRTTFASTNSNFTLAVAQVNVSSFSELLNQETMLPGSARLMAGRLSRRANESVVARFTGAFCPATI